MNNKVIEELDEAINDVYNTPAVKTVIISGAGEKAFVAGADISELASLNSLTAIEQARKVHDLFNKIENCPKPIIAAVNGFALGGGLELALACHLMIASENAKFGLPETGLGVTPAYGGTQRLTYRIGKIKALELMMTDVVLNASEAEELRLTNHVVPLAQLLDKAHEIAQKTHAKAPLALSMVIACSNEAEKADPKGSDNEIKRFGECFATKDSQEGIKAFLEKRKPNFNGE